MKDIIRFIVTFVLYAFFAFLVSTVAVWLVCLLLGLTFSLKYVGVLVVVWFYYKLMYGLGDDK